MDTVLVRIALILVAIFVLFALVSYYNSKKALAHERFTDAMTSPASAPPVTAGPAAAPAPGPQPAGSAACHPRDRLTASDLLPKNAANTAWAQVNPAGQGDVKDQNFLTAGFHVGVDTQGQSLRNANLQIRAEPPNPQVVVSPWNQATITPDTNQKPLM
jgi:hypothetical protein